MPRNPSLPIFLLLLAFLFACGDASKETADPSPQAESDSANAESDSTNGVTVSPDESHETGNSGSDAKEGGRDPEEDRYPLDAFALSIDPRFSADDPHAVAEAREAVVEECMVEAGFRYRAVDVRAINENLRQNFEHPGWIDGDVDYGLGVNFLVPTVIEDPPGSDPNVETLASLTAEERALWSRSRGDCRILSTWRVPASVVDLSTLQDELSVLQERIDSDPRIAAVHDTWRLCMAADGHRFDNRDDILQSLDSAYGPLWVRFLDEGRDYDLASPDLRSNIDIYLEQERAVAEADSACSREMDQTVHEVTVEYQLQFIEDHEDQLALIRHESEQLLLDSEKVEFANIEHFLPGADRTAIVTDPLGRVMHLNYDEMLNSDGPPTTAP